MNILISVNEKYLNIAETMLFSLKRNTAETIDVYLFNHGLSRNQILHFEQYLKSKCSMILSVIDVDSAFFNAFPIGSHFSIEMYYRILAQFLLPESLDRILWLDADIIILKDIRAFYHQSFNGMKYVVCPNKDPVSQAIKIQKERLGIPEEHVYFNSGVMLINLALLRQATKIDHIMQNCIELKERVLYPDQDLLNALFVGQVKYAEKKIYNYQLLGDKKIPKADAKQITILHYTGPKKPWDYHYMNNASKYYWKVRYAQGYWLETIKNYVSAIGNMTYSFLRDIKDLLL